MQKDYSKEKAPLLYKKQCRNGEKLTLKELVYDMDTGGSPIYQIARIIIKNLPFLG